MQPLSVKSNTQFSSKIQKSNKKQPLLTAKDTEFVIMFGFGITVCIIYMIFLAIT